MNPRHLVVTSLLLAALAPLAACGDSKSSGSSKFCDAADAARKSTGTQQQLFNPSSTPTPAQVQPAVEDFAAKFATMAAAAPGEIKNEVQVMNVVAQQLLTLLQTNNYDVTAMSATDEFTALRGVLSSTEYSDAQNRFQRYIDANCAFSTTTSSTTPGATTAPPTT